MVETTYYEDKVYLPRQVREKLGLVDGDVLHIEVVEKGVCQNECNTTVWGLSVLSLKGRHAISHATFVNTVSYYFASVIYLECHSHKFGFF